MFSAALFRARQYLKGSLWIYPLLGAALGPLVAWVTKQADTSLTVPPAWQYTPSAASTVLTTIVGATVGLTGFVVTVTVLAIQMATGTFSARYMRIWYRDPLLKASLTMLVGTLTFSFSLLRQVGSTKVPNIGVSVAGLLLVISLVLFLLFFDRFIHRLRPVAVAALVARLAERIIVAAAPPAGAVDGAEPATKSGPGFTVPSAHAGSVQVINVGGLVGWASRRRISIVMHVAVGDFVTGGQPLLTVYGADRPLPRAHLHGMVALGVERTIEDDPAFAVRIIVDIAVKALSAAINDPTTAVQAMDHLGNVLRLLGSQRLDGELTFRDRTGTPRLFMRGRTWDDYLALGVTEIREYGASTIQVLRRLRAILDALNVSVRPEHRAAVVAELARLDATVAASFGGSIDRDMAAVGDAQGIGGPDDAHLANAETAGEAVSAVSRIVGDAGPPSPL
jgi:uncharacterized membrane protein